MSDFEIRFTKEAKKDIESLNPKLQQKLKKILISKVAKHPHSGKKLVGDLHGFYSMRLSYKDRIVYTIDNHHHIIYIHKTKTHYGD